MGQIVGAAIVSHHPGLVQPKEVRIQRGNGRDSDLIEGFDRVRAKVDALKPDTLVIFDTHWITTSMHLVAGAAHYKGSYTSDELPYSMSLSLRLPRRAGAGRARGEGRAGEEGAGATLPSRRCRCTIPRSTSCICWAELRKC